MAKKFYVTTAIDYANEVIHIGHAYQKVIADVIARWNRLLGKDVFFLTGTDEHGEKIERVAKEKKFSTKEYVDKISKEDKRQLDLLNISYSKFIRTTDINHEQTARKITAKIFEKGDIYKGNYSGLYCIDCESYLTEKDLKDGKCQIHNKEPEKIEEESYFFRLSKYQDKLLKLYRKNKNFILPIERRNEIISRVKEGLKDLSITRTSFRWGIPFPLDEKHVIYVWWEALINYLSGINYPEKQFKKFWPADIHLLGKDNGWFHAVIWPAMLFSLGIKQPETVFVHGFLTFNNQKISKSLGNAINVENLVNKYSADSVRYYLARAVPLGQDGDFSEDALVKRHNTELADKFGNLISRISGLIERNGNKIVKAKIDKTLAKKLNLKQIKKYMQNYEIDKALNEIFSFVDACNLYIQEKKPWEQKDKKINNITLYTLANSVKNISILLWPFIPETCEKISSQFKFNIKNIKQCKSKIKEGEIFKSEILFNKIETNKESISHEQKKDANKESINDKQKKDSNKEAISSKQENKHDKILDAKKMTKESKKTIPFNEWQKLDIRVAKILNVKNHPDADKLSLIEVDLGSEKRTLVAGLKEHYSEKDLKGKLCIVLANLEPKELRGIKSEGMILAAVSTDGKEVILLQPEKDIEPGSRIE